MAGEDFPTNYLEPSSQAWARELQRRIKSLENGLSADSTRAKNAASGTVGTLRKLSEQIAAIEETQAQLAVVVGNLATQQAELAAQVAYTASLISRDSTVPNFNTGTVGSGYAWVGTQAEITLDVPTGRIRVWTTVSNLTVDPGSSVAAAAGFSYAVDGVNTLTFGARACSLYVTGTPIGASVARVGHLEVPVGTITVRAQGYSWSDSGGGSANFDGCRLLVEVVNPA